jgi:hypothetical protein
MSGVEVARVRGKNREKQEVSHDLHFPSFTYYLFPSQGSSQDFPAPTRINAKSDQSYFHFGFANGFQFAAGNTAVGYGFVHR